MKQPHWADAEAYVKLFNGWRRQMTETDAAILAVLGSEMPDHIRPLTQAFSTRSSLPDNGEIVFGLAQILGAASAPKLLMEMRHRIEAIDLSSEVLGGFALGALRASVEIPDFLHQQVASQELTKLLQCCCWPYRVPDASVIAYYQQEPTQEASRAASGLNSAARAFIDSTSGSDKGLTGRRMGIAFNVLRIVNEHPDKIEHLSWVGQKFVKPFIDAISGRFPLSRRISIVLNEMDRITTPPKK